MVPKDTQLVARAPAPPPSPPSIRYPCLFQGYEGERGLPGKPGPPGEKVCMCVCVCVCVCDEGIWSTCVYWAGSIFLYQQGEKGNDGDEGFPGIPGEQVCRRGKTGDHGNHIWSPLGAEGRTRPARFSWTTRTPSVCAHVHIQSCTTAQS